MISDREFRQVVKDLSEVKTDVAVIKSSLRFMRSLGFIVFVQLLTTIGALVIVWVKR